MSGLKVGDRVIVTRHYPNNTNYWYKPGDILTITRIPYNGYLLVKEFVYHMSNGIMDDYVRKLTKLDKALA